VLSVVLDTNVYISALARGGLPLDIFIAATKGEFTLFTSGPILEELERVLLEKFEWAPDRVQQALTAVHLCSRIVFPKEHLTVIKEDDDDNRILECAVDAEAQVIVTGDRDLLELGVYRHITVLNPREFWDTYLS